ncbi:alpha/beta hydrolase [Buchananella felis]|uniref:alpha/beta fold hydrolase n=1 Tax=Buchananella felis TaxID=3231492 RepID=UPI0035291F45
MAIFEPETSFVPTPDGRRLSTISMGHGGQLIVLEAGMGMSARYWAPVMRLLSRAYRVLAYDRAGIGASTRDPAERSLDRQSGDLAAVIAAQDYDCLTLVGHSWGGAIVRNWCQANAPNLGRVRGMVLLDPTDEHLIEFFRPTALKLQRVAVRVLGYLGLLPLLIRPLLKPLGPLDYTPALRASTTFAASREFAAELRNLRDGLEQLARHQAEQPNVPTLLMTAGATMKGESAHTRDAINVAHLEAALKHPNAQLRTAAGATHNMPISAPELVANAIREIAG